MSVSKWIKRLEKTGAKLGNTMEAVRTHQIVTPSPSLNWALSGGIPENRLTLLAGPESSGKSMLAMLALIEVQRKHPDGFVMWYDAEFSFAIDRFEGLGGDIDRIIVKQTNNPVEIFDDFYGPVADMCAEGFPLRAMVIDSVKSIAYPNDANKAASTAITMGGSGAKYLSGPLKLMISAAFKNKVTCLMVQQVYESLDMYSGEKFIIADGKALAHASDLQLMITKLETKAGKLVNSKAAINGGDLQIGHTVRVKVKKNRTGAPARVAEFQIDYNKGIINTGLEVYKLGVALGVIAKVPGSIKWQFGEHIVTGKDNFRELVEGNKELQDEIMIAINNITDDALEASDFVELSTSEDIATKIAALALPEGM